MSDFPNHYYFTFQCGRFTAGEGHYMKKCHMNDIQQDIIDRLEKDGGEKNCKIVIKRVARMNGWTSGQFSYKVTDRWYSSLLTKGVPMAVAVGGPFIAPKIKEYLQ